ncbi:MAG: hypothetical protein WCS88_03860 [Patescibacteria group bacterium]|jgi:hypothetical protein
MRIYLASSWRNPHQQHVVGLLRLAGHLVYDFREPNGDGEIGFQWSEIDPNWKRWSPAQFIEGLRHPVAVRGCSRDMAALIEADACILVLPCGRSAHLELGIANGMGKRTAILLSGDDEPELMYATCDAVCESLEKVLALPWMQA